MRTLLSLLAGRATLGSRELGRTRSSWWGWGVVRSMCFDASCDGVPRFRYMIWRVDEKLQKRRSSLKIELYTWRGRPERSVAWEYVLLFTYIITFVAMLQCSFFALLPCASTSLLVRQESDNRFKCKAEARKRPLWNNKNK